MCSRVGNGTPRGQQPNKTGNNHATQFPTLSFRRNASSTCAEPFQRSLYFGFSVLHRANQSLPLLKPNSAIPYCLNSKSPDVEQRAMTEKCAVVAGHWIFWVAREPSPGRADTPQILCSGQCQTLRIHNGIDSMQVFEVTSNRSRRQVERAFRYEPHPNKKTMDPCKSTQSSSASSLQEVIESR